MKNIGVRLLCTVFNQFVDTIVIYYTYGLLTETFNGRYWYYTIGICGNIKNFN